MVDADERRIRAATCRKRAEASVREADRREWLRMAHTWLLLIPERERTDEDRRNIEELSREPPGTGLF